MPDAYVFLKTKLSPASESRKGVVTLCLPEPATRSARRQSTVINTNEREPAFTSPLDVQLALSSPAVSLIPLLVTLGSGMLLRSRWYRDPDHAHIAGLDISTP